MSVVIIAEAGVNHNGDINLAYQLIDAAVDAGADIVKFQTFNTERLVTPKALKAEYQKQPSDHDETQYTMLKQLELSRMMHEQLIQYCNKCRITFLSTGFDIESVTYLANLGMDRFKIPSGEITNLPYLRHIGAFGKPIILSSGMATLGEIEMALDVLELAGTQRNQVTVLHCNTEYPTPMHDVNLYAMNTIKNAFNVNVGYSDHTIGIEVAIAAVALGASVIEKHITLDRNLTGPDHQASTEPHDFKTMISAIRNIEQALGSHLKRPSISEIKNKSIVRKSLVAAKFISAGELFTVENIDVKRPGLGISPMDWDKIVGKFATRDYQKNELIES